LRSVQAKGFEFYYVLRGSGVFKIKNQQNNEITSDQAFVCNPKQLRSIRNPHRTPLVLLRYSDGGRVYDEEEGYDTIKRSEDR